MPIFSDALQKNRDADSQSACHHRDFLALNRTGFHRVAYTEWEPAESGPESSVPAADRGCREGRTVVCVHGLTRNGRDFDPLAGELAQGGWRVICPDVVGRGKSDWLADAAGYEYSQYQSDMAGLLARLNVATVDWVGTSMGGLIGLLLAARPQSPIRRLVLNDVGPQVPRAALERIGSYVGNDPSFASLEALEAEIRTLYAGFGSLSDGQWQHLARFSARFRPDGRLGLAYDPTIAKSFANLPAGDVMLWPMWDALRCPVLVIRGENSDLLLPETVIEMRRRHPETAFHLVPDAGHAPALMDSETIGVIRDFLNPPGQPPGA